ncbi:hypothetical protein RB195_009337 [Necator americanus]|uniref:SCP domain-containing protein n=1 Tax=Necator americanus TaxID=51031 RepID=A0ABR1CU43_NECAM
MAEGSHTLQQRAVVEHITKAHNLKRQLPERSMESLATTARFVMLNCRTWSIELRQTALPGLLEYLSVQKRRMRDRPVISTENYTTYYGDAEERNVDDCAIVVRKDYNNLVKAHRRPDTPLYDCGIAEDVNSGS